MRERDIFGEAGEAWRITAQPVTAAQSAMVKQWLVSGDFHPLWRFWCVGVTSLRDIAGVVPAEKQYPDGTHEFLIVALNPNIPADPDNIETLHPLLPVDMVYEARNLTDAQAADICDKMVKLIVAGTISPDSDFRSAWETLLPKMVAEAKQP